MLGGSDAQSELDKPTRQSMKAQITLLGDWYLALSKKSTAIILFEALVVDCQSSNAGSAL